LCGFAGARFLLIERLALKHEAMQRGGPFGFARPQRRQLVRRIHLRGRSCRRT